MLFFIPSSIIILQRFCIPNYKELGTIDVKKKLITCLYVFLSDSFVFRSSRVNLKYEMFKLS